MLTNLRKTGERLSQPTSVFGKVLFNQPVTTM